MIKISKVLATLVNEGKEYYVVEINQARYKFGLYLNLDEKPIKKSNNPMDFDEIAFKTVTNL